MIFSAPSSAALAGAQALVVAGGGLFFGRLLAGVLPARPDEDEVHLWALAFPALALYTLLLMVGHMLTGGAVFGDPWIARGISAATFAVLLVRAAAARLLRRKPSTTRSRRALGWLVSGLVVVGLLIWATPIARSLPLDVRGDTNLHAGWAAQLLNGEPTASASITGPIPNFYPWLFHSLLAFTALFTPGGRTFHALAPMQLLQVSGAILALFALGRVLGGIVCGVATVVLGAATGGVGFVMLRGLDVVMDPRADGLRYMGDLLYKRSYNVAFLNLAPPFPRDVGWTLLTGALLLLTLGLQRKKPAVLGLSGVVLGLVGLTGAESFLVGVLAAGLAALCAGGTDRLRVLAVVLGPALLVYALWFGPQVVNYVRLGGYVNITQVGPVTLPPTAILVSWGVVTPLAVLGLGRWLHRKSRDAAVCVVAALSIVAAAAVVVSVAAAGSSEGAFLTLGRAHRYWPLLHFALVLWGGMGASWLIEALGRRSKALSWGLALALVALAVPSPIAASLALPGPGDGLLAGAASGSPRALLNLVAPSSGRPCHAAVPPEIDSLVWAYTGYRLVSYNWGGPLQVSNPARIRWRDIYEHVTPAPQRLRDNRILTLGRGPSTTWRGIAQRYGVDVVVVPNAYAASDVFDSLPGTAASDGAFTVVRLSDC
ncbi:MAG: hypothetical protein ABR529_12505 [Actinomycetota bacterium]